ncbi:hypothetical protein KEM52_005758 [Ascosphaera acerosa]|nr:hypothetical protein KEM52_005758 [Ascosphaera acerosa]
MAGRQLFVPDNQPPGAPYGGCALTGIPLSGGRHLGNMGDIVLCVASMIVMGIFIACTERRKAAVGRRFAAPFIRRIPMVPRLEMQLLMASYILVELCEIFSVGGLPLDDRVRKVFTAAHVAATAAASLLLLVNGITSLQLRLDGDAVALFCIGGATFLLACGTGYIALDAAFSWTGTFTALPEDGYRSYALFAVYQLFPLLCIVCYAMIEGFICLHVLGEKVPFAFLLIGAGLFAMGQIFQYVASKHICSATHGKINGSVFANFFTSLALASIWILWSVITEDELDDPEEPRALMSDAGHALA